ncbi:polysaccharide deacetylase family protein [Clostridium folliculivorans]|uniref:Polysaccharide deacetylase n=1 Tax=Clostridium folliculivorans TaxID=2886038 RepID=A0A9W6D927_9CLOT|nr:polysaccharide deacetylase family protein [Clostridium folliculivorans]GKU23461.1 polysaccharide deacetylase [Clostridium folliculivorans]GKU29577.1 polysaccharide deacetylase [Clostridium folliculivorans]
MAIIKQLFPRGIKKAFTLSYDDGITQDKRLVNIFNKYNLKATFNLNSGLQNEDGSFVINDLLIKRINENEIVDVYRGHEIAIHGLRHLSLTDITKELVIKEILEDKQNHEKIFGYPVRGMAYPYGVYNKTVFEVLETLGVAYSRTVNNHGKFDLPLNYLEWNPTAHHNVANLMSVAERFIKEEFNSLGIFYLWGHSYEFDLYNNWQVIEELCKYVSNKEDIWYATNIQIIDYLTALNGLKFSKDYTFVYNPSELSVWIEFNGISIEIKAGETKILS